MEKTNIQHLKDIVKDFEAFDPIKAAEADEFLNAIQDELNEKDKEIMELDIKTEYLEDTEQDYDNRNFVGLDTVNWSLDNGNLKIQSQMELFIAQLQKQNMATAAFDN